MGVLGYCVSCNSVITLSTSKYFLASKPLKKFPLNNMTMVNPKQIKEGEQKKPSISGNVILSTKIICISAFLSFPECISRCVEDFTDCTFSEASGFLLEQKVLKSNKSPLIWMSRENGFSTEETELSEIVETRSPILRAYVLLGQRCCQLLLTNALIMSGTIVFPLDN